MMDNYPMAASSELAVKAKEVMHNPTIGENIDRRIASLQDEIRRLTELKEKLQSPTGLLFVPIEDLRRAMMY